MPSLNANYTVYRPVMCARVAMFPLSAKCVCLTAGLARIGALTGVFPGPGRPHSVLSVTSRTLCVIASFRCWAFLCLSLFGRHAVSFIDKRLSVFLLKI